MIDALISGKLYGTPEKRTSKAGKLFVIAKVRAAAGNGDSVALSGSLTPRV
jgi:hypothetical protein